MSYVSFFVPAAIKFFLPTTKIYSEFSRIHLWVVVTFLRGLKDSLPCSNKAVCSSFELLVVKYSILTPQKEFSKFELF